MKRAKKTEKMIKNLFLKFFSKTSLLLAAALLIAAPVSTEGAEALRIEQQEEAYIGCEVVLSLKGDALGQEGVVYDWSFEGNAKPISLRKGGLECRFTPVDTEPVIAAVSASGPDGDSLGTANISVKAKEFNVEVVMIKPDPFLLWDVNKKQDVPAEGLIAGEPIRFTVALTPTFKDGIQCRWNTDASTAIREGGEKNEVTVVRNEIGDAVLSVVVSTASGTVLGHGEKSVNVPIARSRVDDSIRRRKAWGQWTEALDMWDAKNFDNAIVRAREAAENDPETLEISDGLRSMTANFNRVERSRKLSADAASLQNEHKPVEALKVMRRAYAAWPLEDIESNIRALEVEIDEARIRRQKAEWLKDTAAAYDQENLFEDALKYYRETMALVPDDGVAQRADRIEKRLASIAQANSLASEGEKLEAEGRLTEALEKYRDSLKLEAVSSVESHAQDLEEAIKERRTRAAALRREAADLQKKNQNAQALVRFKESQALWPDDALAKQIAALEKTVKSSSTQVVRAPEDFGIGTQADAMRLLQEGHALYKQGKYREALDSYRKSYAISRDPRLSDWISRVETSLREYESVLKANVLIKEANSLYNEGRYAEALAKYRESLSVHANAEVENFTRHIESTLGSADIVPTAAAGPATAASNPR
ncbi:MAG: tetratricopeptide repeat protein [Synergistaceae bacterium]|nr:tetratricopeptide repeat protein [Synergistaceae bacterium]